MINQFRKKEYNNITSEMNLIVKIKRILRKLLRKSKITIRNYHPNYFDKNDKSSMRKDCYKRLKLIKSYIINKTILDVGCSGGFYSFGLAENNKSIYAIDNVPDLLIKNNELKEKHKINNVTFQIKDITDIIDRNEKWDVILYLSIHHHIIAKYGFKKANEILLKLSEKCYLMFFDMGQKNEKNCENHKWWNLLPDNDNQVKWLRFYLFNNTRFTKIEKIGSSKIHEVKRFLWMMEK